MESGDLKNGLPHWVVLGVVLLVVGFVGYFLSADLIEPTKRALSKFDKEGGVRYTIAVKPGEFAAEMDAEEVAEFLRARFADF